jgi:class 3 adenylate cyclase
MKRPAAHYFACLLGGPAGVAVLGGATAYATHQWAAMPDLAARLLAMAAGTLAMGYAAFRPIAAYLAAGAQAEPPAARFHRLPLYSALWTAAFAGLALASHLASMHGEWSATDGGDYGVLAAMLGHLVLFAAYIGLLVYFLAGEFVTSLRIDLWSRLHVVIPVGRGSLALRVVVGFAAAAAAPFLLVLGEAPSASLSLAADSAAHHHASLRQLLQMDLLAAGLFTAALVLLAVRAVSRPVRSLLEAMQRVDRGDLSSPAPIVSDDELGSLTSRFNAMLHGLAQHERVRRTFGRFVPEEIAAALLAQEGAIEPQERVASVLFTDIEHFTQLASRLEPRQVLGMLNNYFASVAAIIHGHGGVITQFQGDAVLAVFNLPAPASDHARRALDAAVKILDVVPRTRVGISTGRVVGGTVGGGERLGYTVHGDTVNLAARLEEMNKDVGSRILIDGHTAERLEGRVPLRDHGAVAVRGLPVPIRIYEPLEGQR